jgi:hypothetical protein
LIDLIADLKDENPDMSLSIYYLGNDG